MNSPHGTGGPQTPREAGPAGRGPQQSLTLRLLKPVPVFGSGAEAAAHGMRDITRPSPRAITLIQKIRRTRAARGVPVDDPDFEDRRTAPSAPDGGKGGNR